MMKVDKKGEIVWTVDANYKVLEGDYNTNYIDGLQVVNGNYVLSYTGNDDSEKPEDEFDFGVGTCYLVVDKDGNIVLEQHNKNDEPETEFHD